MITQHTISTDVMADAVSDWFVDLQAEPWLMLINQYTSVMFQNTSDVVIRVTEYRYTSRTGSTATSDQDISALTSNAGFQQYDTLPTGYYAWTEGGSPLDNVAFWRHHKPFRPRVRRIRPGKVMCFNTYTRAFLDYEDFNQMGSALDPDPGMIKRKTVRALYTIETENVGYCTTSDEVPEPGEKHIRSGPWSASVRAISRVKSRAVTINYPSINGGINPKNVVTNDDARPLVPAGGHELHFANSYGAYAAGSHVHQARQVDINNYGACGEQHLPQVQSNILGQPIDVQVIP